MKLSQKYEEEQFELKAQIKHMKKIATEEKAHELNADGFLKIVRKYYEIEELKLDILQEFIDKIVILSSRRNNGRNHSKSRDLLQNDRTYRNSKNVKT